jgi:hypothetical protein
VTVRPSAWFAHVVPSTGLATVSVVHDLPPGPEEHVERLLIDEIGGEARQAGVPDARVPPGDCAVFGTFDP